MNALDVFADARPDVAPLDPMLRDVIAAEVFGGAARTRVEPRDHRRAWVLAGAAAALVALVAGLLALDRPDDASPVASVPPVVTDTVAPTVPPAGEPLRLLPAGATDGSLEGFVTTTGAADSESLVVSRCRPDGTCAGNVVVSKGRRDSMWFDTERADSGQPTEVEITPFEAGGRSWTLIDLGPELLAQTDLGDGASLWVTSPLVDLEADRATVLAVAGALDVAASGAIAVEPASTELEVVAAWASTVWPTRVVTLPGPSGAMSLRTHATANTGVPYLLGRYDVRPMRIRGYDGYASTTPFPSVVWEEQPGQWAELIAFSADVTADDLAELADTLVVASTTEWDAAVHLPDGMAGIPATTAPAAPDTVAPVVTTAPVGTSAPHTAPPGTVLVANTAQISGLAGQWSAQLAAQGADVVDPVEAAWPGGGSSARTWVFARSDAMELAGWIRDEVGVETINPFDDNSFEIAGDLAAVDVLVVLGIDKVPADFAAGRPIVFGDSVVLAATDELSDRGYIVNAQVSRQLVDLVRDVGPVVDAVRPQVVVIHVGTNGPFQQDDLDALLAVTADVPNVILVTVHADRSWVAANNALLEAVDAEGDNLWLLDWDSLADECPGDCFAADGIHLAEAGARYFAERLGDITGL